MHEFRQGGELEAHGLDADLWKLKKILPMVFRTASTAGRFPVGPSASFQAAERGAMLPAACGFGEHQVSLVLAQPGSTGAKTVAILGVEYQHMLAKKSGNVEGVEYQLRWHT